MARSLADIATRSRLAHGQNSQQRAPPAFFSSLLKQSRHTIRWHEGTLYPVLHRLEKRGLLTSEWIGRQTGRPRRYYRLTARGQRLWREQRNQWRAFSRSINALLGQ